MIGLLFLGLVAVIVVVAMVLVLKPDDPVTTSTSSTATSTTTPEMNTVSETSTLRALCFFRRQGAMSHIVIFDANICLPVEPHSFPGAEPQPKLKSVGE